jgi:hypothetical protein
LMGRRAEWSKSPARPDASHGSEMSPCRTKQQAAPPAQSLGIANFPISCRITTHSFQQVI